MRGIDYHKHPATVMGKKSSPCGRADGNVEVEDHGGVGFMFVGTSDIDQAKRILEDYVDNPEDYRFAARTGRITDKGKLACCVWLTNDPGGEWIKEE